MQNSILEQAKLDHEIRQIWFSTRKKKYNLVFYFLNVYVSWIQWEKILISCLHLQNSGILHTKMDERKTPWNWILAIFKYKNEYHRQLELKK